MTGAQYSNKDRAYNDKDKDRHIETYKRARGKDKDRDTVKKDRAR